MKAHTLPQHKQKHYRCLVTPEGRRPFLEFCTAHETVLNVLNLRYVFSTGKIIHRVSGFDPAIIRRTPALWLPYHPSEFRKVLSLHGLPELPFSVPDILLRFRKLQTLFHQSKEHQLYVSLQEKLHHLGQIFIQKLRQRSKYNSQLNSRFDT